eukprot:scaffold32972_cov28-Tisochrysis_lutea.AAC.7
MDDAHVVRLGISESHARAWRRAADPRDINDVAVVIDELVKAVLRDEAATGLKHFISRCVI